VPHIDAVTTLVERMERTLQFYRLLGFDIPTTADAERYVTIDLGNGLRFEWTTEAVERSFNPDRQYPKIRGRMGITLRCAGAAEVDATFHTLVNAGHTAELEPFDAPWGSRHCRVLDPDDNAVDLFAPLP
jgi:catechol 2,3-dioxygenase-like lactoylglutathione lyase family enzyme